jgi:hypothetical protein
MPHGNYILENKPHEFKKEIIVQRLPTSTLS